MHLVERALRNWSKTFAKSVWLLPPKYSAPLASVLVEVPQSLAAPQGLYAVVSFVDPRANESFGRYDDVAIIIQGPSSTEDAAIMIEETVSLYRRNFPGAKIILSTWLDTKCGANASFDNTHLLTLEDPGPSYPSNILRQQVSTSKALELAKSLKCKFALKTRVDHRIYSPGAINYLEALLHLLPNEDGLCVSSYGSGKYRLYGFTEQLQFGTVDALLRYWEGDPSISAEREDLSIRSGALHLRDLGSVVHETRLNTRYLERLGVPLTWDWESNLSALRAHFAIADSSALEHVQLGRTRSVNDHVYPWNNSKTNAVERHLQTADWLMTLSGVKFCNEPSAETLIAAMKVPVAEKARLLDASGMVSGH